MKNLYTLITVLFSYSIGFSQEIKTFIPTVAAKWAPTGLIAGSFSLLGEYRFDGKHSLTAKIGIPVNAGRHFDFEEDNVRFNMRATSFMAGFRHYFSRKKKMSGLYLEPYFKYVHHSAEGIANTYLYGKPMRWNLSNDYNAFGVGAQLGAQFIIGKRFVVDLFFLGPELNSASNNFKAVDVSGNSALPWLPVEQREAEAQIKSFFEGVPIIGKKVKVKSDAMIKTVAADFKGALPGIRTGISIGFAF